MMSNLLAIKRTAGRLLLAIVALLAPSPAFAVLELDITEGIVDTDGDMTDDCNTSGGAPTCVLTPNASMTLHRVGDVKERTIRSLLCESVSQDRV